jgi:hypothetical protein
VTTAALASFPSADVGRVHTGAPGARAFVASRVPSAFAGGREASVREGRA